VSATWNWLAAVDVQQLVPSLLHSLWQAAVIAGLLALVLRVLPAARAELRYVASVFAIVSIVAAWLVTWSVLDYRANVDAVKSMTTDVTVAGGVATNGGKTSAFTTSAPQAVEASAPPAAGNPVGTRALDWQAWSLVAWLLGVVVMFARLTLLVALAWRTGRRSHLIDDPAVLAEFHSVRTQFAIRRQIRLAASDALASPAVWGAIWPTVLLPAAVLGEISPEQLRLVLAHELAHVRRHDYLVNLMQLGVEAVLFFNPAVWWISRQVRLEREACCDAWAARVTGSPTQCARALVDWAARSKTPELMLAFANRDKASPLRDRISRLVVPGYRPVARVSPGGLLALVVVGGVALVCATKTAGVAVTLAASAVAAPAEGVPSPGALYEQMQAHSTDTFRTVQGRYLWRTFQPLTPEREAQIRKQVESTIDVIRLNDLRNNAQRPPADRKDNETLARELADQRTEMLAQQMAETRTAVIEYAAEGDKYRYLSYPVTQAGTLEEMRAAGVAPPERDVSEMIWDGAESTHVLRPLGNSSRRTVFVDAKRVSVVVPTKYGHEVPPINWFVKGFLHVEGWRVTRAASPEGDDALLLTIGDKKSLVDVEQLVLPDKGYVIRRSVDRHGGKLGMPRIEIHEDCSDLVQAAPGIWLPRHILREEYAAAGQLRQRWEFLALEDPRVNAPLPDGVFDAPKSERAKVVRQ